MVQKLVAANQFTITDTNDGIAASLTSEAITLAADASGNVASFAGASAIMSVSIGQYDDSSNWTYFVSALGAGISYYGTGDVLPRSGYGAASGVIVGGVIQIAALTSDSSFIDVTASKSGFASMTKRINVAKSRNGASARTVKLGASPALAFLTPSGSSTPAPASIMLTATAQGLASPAYAWQIDGVNQAGANTASFNVSSFTAGSAKTVKVIATDASGSVEDVTTIASIKNGDTGATGTAGQNFVINLATTELWDAAVNTNGSAKYGAAFVMNGDGNRRVWGVDPFGRPALVWKTTGNDVTSDADGGWNKEVPVVDNKSYMSVVYVRRTSASTVGQYYHGCTDCLLPNGGGAAANPYFQCCGISTFAQNEWYVSIGFIHANGQATPATGKGGLYRLSDGAQVIAGSDYRMAAGQTIQLHRTYMCYSTDPTASLEWWGAGFYEINGNEPSMQTLIGNPNWQNSALIPTINAAQTAAVAAAATDATAKATAAQTAATAAAAADATAKANVAAATATWTGVTGTGKPADNSNNTSIDASGNIQGVSAGTGLSVANNQDSIIRAPGGGIFVGATETQTGRLKIRLPVGYTSTMLKMTVDIYEYIAGYACSLEISGYNYSGGFWTNPTARVLGGSNVEYPVYFGTDPAGYCCIWIGATTGETWTYPQVSIRDVFLGYGNYSRAMWEAGWIISFDTTAIVPGTGTNQYSAVISDTLPGADWAKTSKIPTNLTALTGSESINNANVTLSPTGVLGGAGGGQIKTIGVFDDSITARATDRPPSAYSVGTTKEFKTRSAFTGLGGSDTYFTLETIIQYSDASGGAAYQYAYVGATTWRRVGVCGAASWSGSWVQDLDRAAYTGALDATRNVNRGAWASGVIYYAGDTVTSLGSSWSCLTPHTSSASLVLPVLPATSNANWSLLSSAGANGTTGYTLNFTGPCGYALGSQSAVLKTANTGSWDTQAYSTESYTRGCYVSAKASTNNVYAMFGLTSDPTASASYYTIDYAWFIADSTNLLRMYENGADVGGGAGNYTPDTLLSITYDGQNIRYLKDGVVMRTVARPIGAPLFFDSSYVFAGGITNLQFGPMGEAGIRGSVKRYATGGVWSDAVALTAVGGTAVAGDEVTITDGSTFVMTKYYSAGAWTAPGTVIDGNLMVTGSIKGVSLDVQAIRGKTLSAGMYMDAGTTATAAVAAPAAGATTTVPVINTDDFPSEGTALVISFGQTLTGYSGSTVMTSFRYSGKTQTSLLSADWLGWSIAANSVIVPMPVVGGVVTAPIDYGATSVQVWSEFNRFRKTGGNILVIQSYGSSYIASYAAATVVGGTSEIGLYSALTGCVGMNGDISESMVIDLPASIPSVALSVGTYSSLTIGSGNLELFSTTGGMFYLNGAKRGYMSASGSTLVLSAPVTIATAATYYLIPLVTNTIVGSTAGSLVTVGSLEMISSVTSVIGSADGNTRFGHDYSPGGSGINIKTRGNGGGLSVANYSTGKSSSLSGESLLFSDNVNMSVSYSAKTIGGRSLPLGGQTDEVGYPLQSSRLTKDISWIAPKATGGHQAIGIDPVFPTDVVPIYKNQTTATEYGKRRRFGLTGGAMYAAGFYTAAAHYFQSVNPSTSGGFFASFSFSPTDTNGSPRQFVGMRAAVAAPGNASPATLVNVIGVAVIPTDLTQMYLCVGGSAAQTPVPTGVSPTGVYRVSVFCPRASGGFSYVTIEDISVVGAEVVLFSYALYNDGLGVTMPLPNTALAPVLYRSCASGASTIDVLGVYIETDI